MYVIGMCTVYGLLVTRMRRRWGCALIGIFCWTLGTSCNRPFVSLDIYPHPTSWLSLLGFGVRNMYCVNLLTVLCSICMYSGASRRRGGGGGGRLPPPPPPPNIVH